MPTRLWVRGVLAALVVVLVAGAGFVGGLAAPLFGRPDDTSVEAGFARDMSTHHAQAVEMSLEVYPKATREEVRIFSVDMATTQQWEIGMMQTWLAEWRLSPNSDQPAMAWMPNGSRELTGEGLMPGMATRAEMDRLRSAKGVDVDILFCQLMIRHHLGGIHMIDAVLKQSDNETVLGSARKMRAVQSKEIGLMEGLLAEIAPAK